MKIIFGLGHPAHFHLFRFIFEDLKERNISFKIVIQQKDILEQLLDLNQYDYEIIFKKKYRKSLLGKIRGYIESVRKLIRIAKDYSPDLMIGSISQLAHVGFLLRIKSVFTAEDDFAYTWIQGLITYPFISRILSPIPTNVGPFKRKKIAYSGYHKLAYLHPDVFTPDYGLIQEQLKGKKFFLIRLVNLQAYHDLNKKGLSIENLKKIITLLEKYGAVYISSEDELESDLKKYELNINPMHMHHYIYYASLFIGDSQSMAVESALLGTPSVRINSFYNKISVLKELEFKYKLTYSFHPGQISEVLDLLPKILNTPKETFAERRSAMLGEKINVSQYFIELINSFPDSINTKTKNIKKT